MKFDELIKAVLDMPPGVIVNAEWDNTKPRDEKAEFEIKEVNGQKVSQA